MSLNKGIFAISLAASLLFSTSISHAFSAVNYGTHTKNGVEENIIAVAGSIIPEDGKRLIEVFEKYKDAKTLWIGSPGGSFNDALMLANYIRNHDIKVIIPPDEVCASGCSLMFFASKERTVHFTSKIGVHRAVSVPFDSKTKEFEYDKRVENDSSKVIDTIMLTKLVQWEIPPNIISALMETSQLGNPSIKFFNSVDLHDSGLDYKMINETSETMGEFKIKVRIHSK